MGFGVSEIAEARIRLRDQLVLYTRGFLAPEQISLYTPTIVAPPCMWIGQPGVNLVASGGNGGRLRMVTFGVYTVPEGYEPSQCEWLDEAVARVADAIHALSLAEDGGADPQSLDIGGSFVRAVVHDVAMTTYASSFCTPPAPVPPKTAVPV